MILVIGNLDFNNYNISGQTLRAKSVLDLLKDKYKNEDLEFYLLKRSRNLHNWS